MAGIRITQQGSHALAGRRYGSFADKETPPTHPVGVLTQQGSHALAMRRYKAGAFADKAAGAAAIATYIPTFRRRRR